MAGRGTDIKNCGKNFKGKKEEGKKKSKKIWGVFFLRNEKQEKRRNYKQFKGRTGRQRDQGKSIFFIIFEECLS